MLSSSMKMLLHENCLLWGFLRGGCRDVSGSAIYYWCSRVTFIGLSVWWLSFYSIMPVLGQLLIILWPQVAIRNIRRDAIKAYEKLEKVCFPWQKRVKFNEKFQILCMYYLTILVWNPDALLTYLKIYASFAGEKAFRR